VFDPSSRWPSEEDLHRHVDVIHAARVMRVTRRRTILAATR
jgi:hypothetical protein